MNKLFYGDNLDIMRKFIPDESVDLCYIDPPFNSKRNYNQIYNNIGQEDAAQAQAFIDTWTWDDAAEEGLLEIQKNAGQRYFIQTVYLINGLEKILGRGTFLAYIVSLTRRINEIRRVLKRTGNFYLHCDPTASHYLKLVLDSIFCSQGGEYQNEIIWPRTNAHNFKALSFARVHDVIMFYTMSDKYTYNRLFSNFSPQQIKRYRIEPETGRYITGQDLTIIGGDMTPWRGTTPNGVRGWGLSLEEREKLWESGLILTKKDGSPRLDGRKVYLDEKSGVSVSDVWHDVKRIANTSPERLGYPTQKPEALLERIIRASSNEGDTVLDAYCGCGTTVAVAQRLNRKWIGIDITYQSISLIIKRLEDTYGKELIQSVELFGVPKDFESARAFALKRDDSTRKEFEKWAILTYSDNRAMINEKKGSDKGIDGVAFIMTSHEETREILFSVKSGRVQVSDVRDLRGTIEREKAAGGIFITLNPPTGPMIQEAKSAGFIENPLYKIKLEKIKIITVEEILSGTRLILPLSFDVVKKARRNAKQSKQGEIFDDE